jgi:hypothetical protein
MSFPRGAGLLSKGKITQDLVDMRFDMPFDRLTAMSSVEWLTALS